MNAETTHHATVADPRPFVVPPLGGGPPPEGGTTNGHPPATLNKGRLAFLANQRQELLEPASALLELTTMLARDAVEKGHQEFLRDQQKACASAERLLALIQQLLDPVALAADQDHFSRARHDVRTPLT